MKIAQATGEKQWWRTAWMLGFFAFALYAVTIGSDYTLDDELVTRNHPLTSQGIKAIPQIFTSYYYDNQQGNYYEYRPVVLASFAIEHTFFGDNPHVGHAINALLYGLACMVLLFVLRALQPSANIVFPALATLLFAAHPIHTEVVASIKNRDEIFSFIFGISAMLFALRFGRDGALKPYLLFLLLIVLSVMSKRTVLSYAVIIPLAVTWFSSAGLGRLLSLSFPLMLIVLFFSPIYEQDINGLIVVGIIVLPVILWVVKVITTQGIKNVASPLKQAIASIGSPAAATNSDTKPSQELPKAKLAWLQVLVPFALAIGALVAQYVDLRVLMVLCSAFLFAAVFVLQKPYKPYPVLLLMFVAGFTLSNFGYPLFALFALGAIYVNLYDGMGYSQLKIPVVILGVLFALVYWFLSPVKEGAFVDVAVLLLLLTTHYLLIKRWPKLWWAIPFVLLFFAVANIILEAKNLFGYVPHIVGALYLSLQPRISKPLLVNAVVAATALVGVFVITVYPLHPENPIYERNLGSYYASLPDPYGDGEKTVTSVVPGAGREVDPVENPLVNEKNAGTRIATAAKVMGYYTYLFVAPLQLRFYYGFNQIQVATLSSPVAWACIVGFVALLAIAFWAYKKDVLLSFALLYLLFGLLFVSNIGVLITGIVAERLVFSTSLGFVMLVAWAIIKLFKLPLSGQVNFKQMFARPALAVVMLSLMGFYVVRTEVRNLDWRNKETLYVHDAKISPNSAKVQQLAGNYYLTLGLENPAQQEYYFQIAEPYLQQSLKVAPELHLTLGDLGNLYGMRQDCKTAVSYFDRFVKISPPPPPMLFTYALCLDILGRYQEAVTYYERYIAYQPNMAQGYSNLAFLYYNNGNIDKALETSLRAVKALPNNPDNYVNTAAAYLAMNRLAEAVPYLEKAHSLAPNDLKTVLMAYDVYSEMGNQERVQYFYNRALQMGHRFQ